MGFRQGDYARVFSVDDKSTDKGAWCQGRIVVSKKNKKTNTYETKFQDGYVRFVGDAYSAIMTAGLPTAQQYNKDIHKGVSIKITSCDVTNYYVSPEGKVSYTPNYVIFGLEFPNNAPKSVNTQENTNAASTTGGQDDFMNIPDGIDEELPFN